MLPFARSIRAMPAVMPSRSRNQTGDLASILNSLRNQGIGQPTIDNSNFRPRLSTQPAMSYDEAMARNMTRDMKRPEEQAQIDAAIAAGPMEMTGEYRGPSNPFEGRAQLGVAQRIGESDEDYNIRSGLVRDPNRRRSYPFQNILSGLAGVLGASPERMF